MLECPFSVKEILWVETELGLLVELYGRGRVGAVGGGVEMPGKFYFLMLVVAVVNRYKMGLECLTCAKEFIEEAWYLEQTFQPKRRLDSWPSKKVVAKLFPMLCLLADRDIDELHPWAVRIMPKSRETAEIV